MGRGGHRPERDGDAGIEFLAPDTSAFAVSSAGGFVDVGDDRAGDFDDDQPRSSRVTIAIAVAVVALFSGGLIAAAPWRSQEITAPPARPTPTTTPAPASTVAAPTSTVNDAPIGGARPSPPLDTGYVSTAPPAGFELAGLYTSSSEPPEGWLEVWAEPGATRHRGSWFAVQVSRRAPSPVGSGAQRVELGGGRIGLLQHTSDGIAELTFALTANVGVTLTAGGQGDLEVIALAAGIGHVGLEPVFGAGSTAGHELVWAGAAPGASIDEVFAYGDARAGALYRRRADDASIRITVSTLDLTAPLAPFVLTQARGFSFSGPAARISINGRPTTGGLVPGLDDAHIVSWVEEGETIAVVSELPLVELLEVAATVRGATPEAWRDAMMEARGFGPPPSSGAKADIRGGLLTDGRTWRVELDGGGTSATLVTDSSVATAELDPRDDPLHVFSSLDATVVVARVPAADGEGLVLRVEGQFPTVDVALAPTGAGDTPFVAAHAFDALGSFRAALLGAEGTAVATVGAEISGAPASGG